MNEQIRIATWNLCLGLFHKKDYVKSLLLKNKIDVLNLQETEIKINTNEKTMHIPGYSLETEKSTSTKRVATYISNNVKYRRRSDLEDSNNHLIILDLGTRHTTRIINLYRPFNPTSHTEREFFNKQISKLDQIITNNTIILGDFNMDLKRANDPSYSKKFLLEDFNNTLGHHNLNQCCNDYTWNRVINGVVKQSLLDHIYESQSGLTHQLKLSEPHFGDHKLLTFLIKQKQNIRHDDPIIRRNWTNYSKAHLIEKLNNEDWCCNRNDVQSYFNWMESQLINIIDKLAPVEVIQSRTNKHISNEKITRLINKKRKHLKNWKRHGRVSDRISANILNKQIRNSIFEEQKQQVRRKIKPGNSKTLWESVKIASDKELITIPEQMHLNQIPVMKEDRSEAFANFFKEKVESLARSCTIEQNVYNGEKILNSTNENFMTEYNILQILKTLKIKNCEGFDRIPLRVFNEGAEILIAPLAKLFQLIYSEKRIPEQWKTAKLIPLHKKGAKEDISNYRPISNLCSMSKIYEKLILQQLLKIAKENNVDLTGDSQHGFKQDRSTVTAAAEIQSLISRAIDENNYYVLASLDLSAAFDLVNRELLFERMQIMGIPDDIVTLLKDWLNDRKFYVDINGNHSTLQSDNYGTIQGSVLGPILFSIFIRPIYDLEDLITYADDNYLGTENTFLSIALAETKRKIVAVSCWLKKSGLKINDQKTEICIFHRKEKASATIKINNNDIKTSNQITILGIIFDSNLTWDLQYNNAIKEANHNLYAIKIISKYFTKEEKMTLLTSLFYSKLYYGSEVWHIPGRTVAQNKKLKLASANAIRSCDKTLTIFHSHTQIHSQANRALPDQILSYKHAITMFKLFKHCQPENEFMHMNFQLNQNPRLNYANFFSRHNYDSGKNILLNRLSHLNGKIEKSWLELSLDSFKVRCKQLFLQSAS